jgi:hypothetical protein
MPREVAIPVSSFAALFAIGHVGRRGYAGLADRERAGDHFAPLPPGPNPQCKSRAGRWRRFHEYDRDGVCYWCDRVEGADAALS